MKNKPKRPENMHPSLHWSIIESLGDFHVTLDVDRNYLYFGEDRIAECVWGDFKERYGNIKTWVKKVMGREVIRMQKIISTQNQLSGEYASRKEIVDAAEKLFEVGEKVD